LKNEAGGCGLLPPSSAAAKRRHFPRRLHPVVGQQTGVPMKAVYLVSFALLTGFVASAAFAQARMPADVAEQWGLIGTWAINCREASDLQNPYYSYLRQGQALLLRRDMGSLKDENEVLSAVITDDDGIELVTDFKSFSHVMTAHYIKDDADQFHPLSNKDEKGVYTIQDGKMVKTGSPSPAMTRCQQADKR
jgi:hypothetical protein